ncbi:MAG: ABC transporter ATP-binding protein [Methylothermaceae bacteria B42]|nr:MAG: ABC transporter ATP-binding protein [Methylothermaceae bacteria B42]HHJ39941.1 ATP-binding cassette domain-containing protein [Methylothermaceae bacterium]
MLIEAEQLYCFYGNHCAVENLNLSLDKGEIVGFLGPNGAGKTTTMQMLCGTLAPSAGQIRINGIDLLEKPKQAKRYLGYLPEIPPLYRELTVNEYLDYCGRLHGLKGPSLTQARESAKERCGLTDASTQLIGNLSKGYQQRVGIAQAILHSPEVVVLDEPTVGLDPNQIREIRELIRELGQEHAVLLSSHILPEVQALCSRVMIIHQGKVALNESTATLEQHVHSSSLILETRWPVDLECLTHLDGVQSIKPISEIRHRYQIFHDKEVNPAEKIAAIIVAKRWGLLELTPVRQSIEQIFVEITRQEKESDEAEA